MSETNPEKLSRDWFLYVVAGAVAFLIGIAVVMNVMSGDTGATPPAAVTTASP
ncbi:MAG: hypothetical protein QM723_08305 [Myxococcaceae bacterium]